MKQILEKTISNKIFNVPEPEFIRILSKFYNYYGYKEKARLITLFLGAILVGFLEIVGLICLYMAIKSLISIDSLDKNHIFIKYLDFFNLQMQMLKLLF